MCCVIPPASLATTFVSLKASSRDVLPWSTWPITVTTGALGNKSASVSSGPVNPSSTSLSATRLNLCPISSTTIWAVSASIAWFIVAITPKAINFLITSELFSAILFASSWTVIISGIITSFIIFSWGAWIVVCTFGAFFLKRRRGAP